MARYKIIDRSPRFLPVVLDAQLMSGSEQPCDRARLPRERSFYGPLRRLRTAIHHPGQIRA